MVKQNSYKYTYESSVRLGEECLRRLSHCVEAKLLSGTEIIESVLQRCIFWHNLHHSEPGWTLHVREQLVSCYETP